MFSQRSLPAGFCWIWPIGGTEGRLMREPWALSPGSASFLLVATSWRPARVQLLSDEPSSKFCNTTSSLFPDDIIVYRKSYGILKKQLRVQSLARIRHIKSRLKKSIPNVYTSNKQPEIEMNVI